MKRQRRSRRRREEEEEGEGGEGEEQNGEVEEDSPPAVSALPQDEDAKTKLLSLHVSPDTKGNVQIGAAMLDCELGKMSTLGRTIAWEGEVLFVLELVLDAAEFDQVLVSSKMSEPVADALAELLRERFGEAKGGMVVLPSAFFDFAGACKLMGGRFGMMHALGSVLDLTNKASVGAAGAAFCHAQRLFPELPPMAFGGFDLGKFMVLDGGSLRALDVVKSEEHPSVIRGRGRSKEGFTLLSLLDRTKSSLGAKTLRRWVVRPLTHLGEIQLRHDAVEFLLHRIGQESMAKMAKMLSQVGDLPRSLLRLKTCTANARDWVLVGESLTNMFLCFQLLGQVKEQSMHQLPHMLENALQAGNAAGLFAVRKALDWIDWEKADDRVVPVQGAAENVDEARRRLLALPDFLAAETASVNVPGFTIRCIPVIGFVAALEHHCAINVEHEEGFELLFEAKKQHESDEEEGEQLLVRYFKTNRTHFLDEQLGDVIGICRDLEDQFVRQVEEVVLAHEAELLLVTHRCAEVDVLLCFAEVAHDFSYVRPELTQTPITTIREARHPLLERVLDDKFVPSDISVEGVLIITGPNFSGKSVALKTLALMSILSQIGSFVPAASAQMGVVDRIFTRMSGLENVGAASFQRESSFTIDVQQVVTMLRCCTGNSLLCIDEFGKGTNTMDGAALLAAVVQHLATAATAVPRTAIATHLVEIFDAKLVDPALVVLGEMRVEFQTAGEPVPLFRLVCGSGSWDSPRDSYGVACAKRVGMCSEVVNRALELCDRLKRNEPLFSVRPPDQQHEENAVRELLASSPHEWTEADLDKFFTMLLV
ncbi:hypothetical protein BASA81_010556 [Batrachochytrium salamandrivorans]|nr:hypothetical protein BASA81_010556 [Batrachochytrium salamandrivorans]